jgi:hypothetical protein
MNTLFNNMPFEVILKGNLFISIIGTFFVFGAPVLEHYKKLKLWFSFFWLGLVIYYSIRLIMVILKIDIGTSLFPWLGLVIMADLPILALAIGYSLGISKSKKSADLTTYVVLIFVFTWVYAIYSGNNICSQVVTFLTFMVLAWSCRQKNINISILWIFYAILNLPLRVFIADPPKDFGNTLFLLLLTSKLSLIVAMYKMLDVKVIETSIK